MAQSRQGGAERRRRGGGGGTAQTTCRLPGAQPEGGGAEQAGGDVGPLRLWPCTGPGASGIDPGSAARCLHGPRRRCSRRRGAPQTGWPPRCPRLPCGPIPTPCRGGVWRACTRSWPRHASFSDSVSTSACRSAVFCILGALITPSRPRGCGPAPAVAGPTASATCAEGAASPASSPAAPLGPRLRMRGLMAPFASLRGRNGRAAIVWSAAHPASQVCPLASGSVDKQAVSCQRLRGGGGRVAPSLHGASARLPALWHPARARQKRALPVRLPAGCRAASGPRIRRGAPGAATRSMDARGGNRRPRGAWA